MWVQVQSRVQAVIQCHDAHAGDLSSISQKLIVIDSVVPVIILNRVIIIFKWSYNCAQ